MKPRVVRQRNPLRGEHVVVVRLGVPAHQRRVDRVRRGPHRAEVALDVGIPDNKTSLMWEAVDKRSKDPEDPASVRCSAMRGPLLCNRPVRGSKLPHKAEHAVGERAVGGHTIRSRQPEPTNMPDTSEVLASRGSPSLRRAVRPQDGALHLGAPE